MYNGMIVTLSSFLDVTDLEVDSIRVRERRFTSKIKHPSELWKRRKSRKESYDAYQVLKSLHGNTRSKRKKENMHKTYCVVIAWWKKILLEH